MNLEDIPSFPDEMRNKDIHVFVGKSMRQMKFVTGFKRDESGYLWVSFFPVSHPENGAMADIEEIVQAVCKVKSGKVGTISNGEFIDRESECQ